MAFTLSLIYNYYNIEILFHFSFEILSNEDCGLHRSTLPKKVCAYPWNKLKKRNRRSCRTKLQHSPIVCLSIRSKRWWTLATKYSFPSINPHRKVKRSNISKEFPKMYCGTRGCNSGFTCHMKDRVKRHVASSTWASDDTPVPNGKQRDKSRAGVKESHARWILRRC